MSIAHPFQFDKFRCDLQLPTTPKPYCPYADVGCPRRFALKNFRQSCTQFLYGGTRKPFSCECSGLQVGQVSFLIS
jgi:hypothetical protein